MIFLASLASSLALLAGAAAAGPDLRFEGCPDKQVNAVRALLAIELQQTPGSESATVEVFCRRDKALVWASLSGQPMTRWLNLRTVGESGRARLMALAIAELVSAQLAEPPPPPPAPEKPKPNPAPPPEPIRPPVALLDPPQLRLQAEALARAFPAGLMLFGMGAQIARGRQGDVGWRVDLQLEGGSASRSLGIVQASSGGIGAAALWSFSEVGPFELEASTGLRGGYARLQGVPIDPWLTKGEAVEGFWIGPSFGLRLLYARRWFCLEFGAEAGAVLKPLRTSVTASGGDEVGVSGGWLGLQIAGGILP